MGVRKREKSGAISLFIPKFRLCRNLGSKPGGNSRSAGVAKITEYWRLMRFHKPIGILLLLWPTLWALWLAARGLPSLKTVAVFVLGVILMRAAGCVINDIADRNFDGQVRRTQQRPLATRAVSVREALILFFILITLAAGLVIIFLNRLNLYLAILGLAIACFYPFTKRFTHLPQVILGLAFAWGIPMAFAEIQNKIPGISWWLFATTCLWIVVYDTFYAMADREDDLKIGVRSTAILFGKYDRLFTILLQTVVVVSFCGIAIDYHLNWKFYLGWSIALLLMLYQQYLIQERRPEACFQAFLNNNWVGFALFFGLWMGLQ